MSDILLGPNQPGAPKADTPALDLGVGGPGAQAQATHTASASDVIKESTTEHFMVDVIEASETQPVIVNFWSPRSEPCKTMVPMLEKLVVRTGGLVNLVKINIDVQENQGLAAQLRVQSVPTLFAFKNGRPADALVGPQAESQVQSFIDKLVGDAKPPIEAAMEQARALLAAGEGAQAEDIFTTVLSQDPSFVPALAGLIRAIAAQGDFERATDIVDGLDTKTRSLVDVEQAVSALELAQQSAGAGGDTDHTDELIIKVTKNPKDLDARFELSLTLVAQGNLEAAIDQLLEIVSIDRTWNDEAGRTQLIKIFDTLGPTDPLTQDARRRLSAVLFS